MSEWRVGRRTGRTLWRDEQLVGMVDSPEIAAEIVEAMNRVGQLLAAVKTEMDRPPWERALCPLGCGFVTTAGGRIGLHFNQWGQACNSSGDDAS